MMILINKNTSRLLMALVAVLVMLAGRAEARYNVSIDLLIDNPMMFPIGNFLPDNFSSTSEIEFGDIQPFFNLTITGEGPADLAILVRFETTGQEIFTAYSSVFPIGTIIGRPYSNTELANINEISLGSGDIDAEQVMPFIDSYMLQEGLYILTVILAESTDWDEARTNNHGSAAIPFYAHTTSQVTLIQPANNTVSRTNPIFQWSFPRRPGIKFHFLLTSSVDVYAAVEIEVMANDIGNDITTYTYIPGDDIRELDPNQTYYWNVQADATTMFPDQYVSVPSPSYQFRFEPPGGGGVGGGFGGGGDDQPGVGDDLGLGNQGQGQGGGNAGSGQGGGLLGGSNEEGGPPQVQDPIFNLLENLLPPELYSQVIAQFDDLNNFRLRKIQVGAQEYTLEDFAIFMASQQPSIISGAVQ